MNEEFVLDMCSDSPPHNPTLSLDTSHADSTQDVHRSVQPTEMGTNKPKEFEQSITLTSNHFITSDPLRTVCLEAAGINAYTD